jgi:hypothetical protein
VFDIDIQQNEYIAGFVAAFSVLFIYATAFLLLRFLANLLIALIIMASSILPFLLLHSGTISTTSELLSISALSGISCAVLCTVVYPYSSIYEKKLQEKLTKQDEAGVSNNV